MLTESNLATKDEQVSQRKGMYQEEKQKIGRYAASLIEPHVLYMWMPERRLPA